MNVRYTWLPWRWRYRERVAPGGMSFTLHPPPRVNQDYGATAAREWAEWEAGGGYAQVECPVDYHRSALQTYGERAFNHQDAAARRRFRRLAEIEARTLAALGECRCGR